MKILRLTAACLLVLLASACKEKVFDVKYYENCVDDRKAMVKRCKNNPGELAETPNCQNAEIADLRASFDPKNNNIPKIK